jgi:hypothetical protein
MLAFPREQALRSTTGKNIGSHTLRALHVNCAYVLHGNSSSMDVFMKNRLQHATQYTQLQTRQLVDTPLVRRLMCRSRRAETQITTTSTYHATATLVYNTSQ